MKSDNVIKMARLMVGGSILTTCEDCLSQRKKLFSDNKCALIEYAEALDKAGYRKRSETVKEFAEKVNEIVKNTHNISSWHIWAIQEQINKLAEQFGKEDQMERNVIDKRCGICGKLVEGWHRYDYDGNPICDNCCINLMQGEIEELKEQLENSVQLPCKVGDTIYEIRVGNRIEGNCIFEHKVRAIHLETNIDTLKQHYYLVCGKDFNEYFWEERYKNYWFSTKPEAEARLKEQEDTEI